MPTTATSGPAAAASESSMQQSQQQQPTAPQPLTFPPSQFAKLAPSDYLAASLSSSRSKDDSSGMRPNGRSPSEVRPPSINTGSLTNANGSAVVRVGSTSVVCGVRAELLPTSHIHGGLPADLEAWEEQRRLVRRGGAEAEQQGEHSSFRPEGARTDGDVIADLRLLVPNLELSTGCNAAHLPGAAPSPEAQALTQRILALLHTSDLVSLAPLLVWHQSEVSGDEDAAPNPNDPEDTEMSTEGDKAESGAGGGGDYEIKAIWTLYIDILYISLDGSAFDAAWLALLAALRDTLLPKARWDADLEALRCSPLRADASALQLRSLPVPLTAAVFSATTPASSANEVRKRTRSLLFDPDDFEESVCQGSVHVVVAKDEGGRVAKKKGGKHAATAADVRVLRVESTGRGCDGDAVRSVAQGAEQRWAVWRKALNWK